MAHKARVASRVSTNQQPSNTAKGTRGFPLFHDQLLQVSRRGVRTDRVAQLEVTQKLLTRCQIALEHATQCRGGSQAAGIHDAP